MKDLTNQSQISLVKLVALENFNYSECSYLSQVSVPNSRHMTPQAPHLGHRKPLHGSAPTCFAQSNSVSSVTAYLTHHRRPQALSGRDGAHLSQVQSNCFVLFSDLSRSEAQSESCVEPANPACFLIYVHAAKHKDQGVF